MATFYWRGSTGRFDLSAGWQIADANGTLSAATRTPTTSDTVVFDTTPMTLTGDSILFGTLDFQLPGSLGAINLGGHRLVLFNSAQLGGSAEHFAGPGVIETDAVAVVPYNGSALSLQLTDCASWMNNGLVVDAGRIALGGGTSDIVAITNSPGAMFAIAADGIAFLTSPGGPNNYFNNFGTLDKVAGDDLTTIAVPVMNSGVILADRGTLELDAGSVLSGTIGGGEGQVRLAGTFGLPANVTDVVTFASGAYLGGGDRGSAVLSGPGTLASTGSVSLVTSSAPQVLLAGGATWSNAGTILAAAVLTMGARIGDAATLANQAGASFVIPGNSGITAFDASGSYKFINAGTLIKSGGAGDSRICVPLYNSGSIGIATGTLEIAAGGSFAGTVSGHGTLAFTGGISTIAANAVISVSALAVTGGTLDCGKLENSGHASWNGGAIVLDAGLSPNPILQNDAGATLTIAANGQRLSAIGGTSAISNKGTLLIDGGSRAAYLDAPLLNDGFVRLVRGTLALDAGGRSNGALLDAAQGGTLLFGGGAFTITGGAYTVRDTVLNGGTLDLSSADAANFGASLRLTAGNLKLGACDASAQAIVQQAGGTISGDGVLTVTGNASLQGGLQSGAGITRLLGGSVLGSGFTLDGGRTLENDGWLNWSTGNVVLGSGTTIENIGVLSIATAGSIGGNGVIENEGVIAVSVSSGHAEIDAKLVNLGIVRVSSGTLDILQPVSGGGMFDIDGNARLDFASIVQPGGSIRFLGGGGTLALDGPGAFGATVAGFGGSNALDFAAIDFAWHPTCRYVAGSAGGTLTVSDGMHTAAVAFLGNYTQPGFQLTADDHGGTLLHYAN